MAETSKLVIQYATMEGTSVNHTWNHSKPEPTSSQVQSLVNGTITAGAIFAKVPVLAKTAKVVTTTEAEYDLNA